MGSFEYDIEVSLIASLCASALTYMVVAVFKIRIPSAANILFWRSFVRGLVITISEVPLPYDPPMRAGEQSPLTPMGDALALGEVVRLMRAHRYPAPEVVSAQSSQALDRVKHQNLLIIGGPKYNFAAQQCLTQLDNILPYQFRRLRPKQQAKRTIRDVDLKRFVGSSDLPDVVPDASQDLDFGMALLARNPYNDDKQVLIIGGLSGLSTLAAFLWLQKSRPIFWLRLRRRKGFQAIVQCRSVATTRVSNIGTKAFNYL